jgi:hypothetical protein
MKRNLLFLAGIAAVAVVFFALGPSPKANAEPFSTNWDVVICDGTTPPNDPSCSNTAGKTIGNGNGIIEVGENPEIKSNLLLDITAGPADESIFGLANSVWQGISGTPGSAITDGDQVGSIFFTIESNLFAPATSNVSAVTGQPPVCTTGAGTLSATFPIYDSNLNAGDGVDNDGDTQVDEEILDTLDNDGDTLIDEDNATVSHLDTDGDGLNQEFEDNVDSTGIEPSSGNGIMDGVDLMPDALATTVIPTLGLGSPTGRAFGLAPVSVGLGVEATLNFLVYDYDLDGDSTPDSEINVTVLNYPGLPLNAPSGANILTDQTVVTCPPYGTVVRIFGVTSGNASAIPPIAGGVANRTVTSAGTFPYLLDPSSTDNYDGDAASNAFDTCKSAVSVDTDLAGHVDPDSDRWDSGCDPVAGSADNDGDTSVGPYVTPPINTFPGAWEPDQDVDGDTTLNTVDECPFTADADLDADTVIDYQLDSDSDTVGDVCDPAPTIKGDGTGYPAPAPGVYVDHDARCIDYFTIPGTELADPAPNGNCLGLGPDNVASSGDEVISWVDSDDDDDPDWGDVDNNGSYIIGEPIDTDSDSDSDGDTDACEAVNGTDPLDASSNSATAGDCDGDGTSDFDEEKAGQDPFVAGPGITATPTATATPLATPTITPTPGGCIDRSGDTTCDNASLDPDDDGCTITEEALLGASFDGTATGWYDVYDVPSPANADPTPNGTRNKQINIGDVLAVLFYAFTAHNDVPNANGVDYDSTKGILPPHDTTLIVDLDGDTVLDVPLVVGVQYDRSPGLPPDPVTGIDPVGPPDGVIDMFDVLMVASQAFKVDCSGPPN